jgi:hypothetical protein
MTDGGVAQLDDEIAGVRAALRWGVLLAGRLNPYHEPAGSPKGGQFAKAPGGGGLQGGSAGSFGETALEETADEASGAIQDLMDIDRAEASERVMLQEQLEARSKKIDELWLEVGKKVRAGDMNSPEWEKLNDEIALEAGLYSQDYVAKENLAERYRLQAVSRLAVADPVQLSPRLVSKFEGTRTAAINEGTRLVNSLVNRSILPGNNAVEFKAGGKGRSSCGYRVYLCKGAGKGVVIHELGHWLEHSNPGLLQRSIAFLDRRRGNEATVSLRQLTGNKGYRTDEKTYKDKFANPYAGKSYVMEGRRYSTEILSVGLEHYSRDPIGFAKSDPDYFRFIYNTVRGR